MYDRAPEIIGGLRGVEAKLEKLEFKVECILNVLQRLAETWVPKDPTMTKEEEDKLTTELGGIADTLEGISKPAKSS